MPSIFVEAIKFGIGRLFVRVSALDIFVLAFTEMHHFLRQENVCVRVTCFVLKVYLDSRLDHLPNLLFGGGSRSQFS